VLKASPNFIMTHVPALNPSTPAQPSQLRQQPKPPQHPQQQQNQMGIIFSATSVTQKIQSKLQSRKQSKLTPSKSEPPNQSQTQQSQPFSPSPPAPLNDSAEFIQHGLAHEHLAASPPPLAALATDDKSEGADKGRRG